MNNHFSTRRRGVVLIKGIFSNRFSPAGGDFGITRLFLRPQRVKKGISGLFFVAKNGISGIK
jgi:hypothetical protein